MSTEPQAAAEWRPDPLGIAPYRWWNGAGWSGYTSDTDAHAPGGESAADDVHVSAIARQPEPVTAPSAPAVVPVTPLRGQWPASLPEPPARRATTLEEAAAGYGELPTGIADDVDWSRLALRLKTTLDAATPGVLRVRAGDLPELVVDPAGHAYWWDLSLAEIPERIASMRISEIDRDDHDPDQPGSDLDPLLWVVAHGSFEGASAPWMRAGDRYRLQRWPNLTTLPHQPHHLRAISLLGQASLTEEEFANIAELEPREAQQLLSTFSLMGLLRVSAGESRPAVTLAPRPKQSGGLFGKLARFFGGR